jgi:hypothetical protein
MIKIFCDCCGKEIPPRSYDAENDVMVYPYKRVRVEPHSESGSTENFLVSLTVSATIYKPKNLMDDINESDFVGNCLCKDCIVESLIQRKD